MITASQSFKIYELLNKHFKNEQDAKALVSEIENVIDNKFDDKAHIFKGDIGSLKEYIEKVFATKEDLANVKVDMIKWLVGIFATLALMIVGLYFKK